MQMRQIPAHRRHTSCTPMARQQRGAAVLAPVRSRAVIRRTRQVTAQDGWAASPATTSSRLSRLLRGVPVLLVKAMHPLHYASL